MSKIPADDPRRRFIYEPPRNPDGTPLSPEQAAAFRAEAAVRMAQWNKAKEERRLERERRLQARREAKVNDDSSGQDETHQE
ncbi:MAG: hypothetical protein J0M33_07855 [Anaerolineae bacterium]|nr:hypothetical protein [Anaerolineae bacterium]